MDNNQNCYIDFKISGLCSKLSDPDKNKFYLYSDKDRIRTVEFFSDNNGINKIRIYYSAPQMISKKIIDNIKSRINLFILSLIKEDGYGIIQRKLKVEMLPAPNQNVPHEYIHIRDSIQNTLLSPIAKYEDIFSCVSQFHDGEAKTKLLIFFELLKVEDDRLRYLMGYEFLKSLIGCQEKCKLACKGQKRVTCFIFRKYNKTKGFNKIDYHKSRKPKTKRKVDNTSDADNTKNADIPKGPQEDDEDDITFCRNLLAHNYNTEEYKKYESLIDTMSSVIIDVIFFAIHECVINCHAGCFAFENSNCRDECNLVGSGSTVNVKSSSK